MQLVEEIEALAVDALAKSYGPMRALESLTLSVAAGSIAGIVGPNGSGKTTTLRAVVGLVRPDAGTIAVAGHPAGTLAARARTAYVPDEPRGLDELTLSEYLALCRALYRADARFDTRAARLAAAFGLEDRLATPLAALSHGMRRQVALVAAFALAPALVIVDEATAALDPEAVVVLREALRALACRGSAVLLATQDLHFAERACDRVYLLSRGRLTAEGSVAALLARFGAGSLEEAFLAALGQSSRIDDLRDFLHAP